MCFGDNQMQFLGGDMAFRFAGDPDQRENPRAGAVEQPHERSGRFRQPAHRDRHRHRDRFGIAKRELLGDQLADDKADEGRDHDHQPKAQLLRGLVRHADQLEPCAMCAAAIGLARIHKLVFAAEDPKGGAVVSGPRLYAQPTCHHRPEVLGGIGEKAAATQLRNFFAARRK
jgi:hypothetical protein